MSWKSEKQIINELKQDSKKLKKIENLIDSRKKANTYNSNGIKWTLPNNNINISVSDLNKILNNE